MQLTVYTHWLLKCDNHENIFDQSNQSGVTNVKVSINSNHQNMIFLYILKILHNTWKSIKLDACACGCLHVLCFRSFIACQVAACGYIMPHLFLLEVFLGVICLFEIQSYRNNLQIKLPHFSSVWHYEKNQVPAVSSLFFCHKYFVFFLTDPDLWSLRLFFVRTGLWFCFIYLFFLPLTVER